MTGPVPVILGHSRADLVSAVTLGGTFLAATLTLAAFSPQPDGRGWLVLALSVAVYVLAYRTEYIHPQGSTVPTEPVLVAMLFLLPLQLVPAAVLVALLLARNPREFLRGPWPRDLGIRLGSGWHCFGPVTVLLIAGVTGPDLQRWPVYVVALLSQYAVDLVTALIRERALGGPIRPMWRPMLWTFAIDTLLAVIGLCAVIAADGTWVAAVLVAVPALLIALLIHDRRGLAAKELDLGRAVEDARVEARVDPMTGLGNRRAWYEAVEWAQHALTQDAGLGAVVIAADLNHLKFANDSLGHEVGDELIKAMARVTLAVAPAGSAVCRIGGDEFTILTIGPATELDQTGLLTRLRAEIATVGLISGIRLSVAIGSATSPPEPTITDALRVADNSVFAEKRSTRRSRSTDAPAPAQRRPQDQESSVRSD